MPNGIFYCVEEKHHYISKDDAYTAAKDCISGLHAESSAVFLLEIFDSQKLKDIICEYIAGPGNTTQVV